MITSAIILAGGKGERKAIATELVVPLKSPCRGYWRGIDTVKDLTEAENEASKMSSLSM